MKIKHFLLGAIICLCSFEAFSQHSFKNEDLQTVNANILELDTTCQSVNTNSTSVISKLESILTSSQDIYTRILKLDSLTYKSSNVSAASTDRALVVEDRPTTATFGSNTPTVTNYSSAGNTISTTNCIIIILENVSATTNATFTYGGVTIYLGYPNSAAKYPTTYTFTMPYDVPSKKYSPFPALVVNALGSSVNVTKYFAQ